MLEKFKINFNIFYQRELFFYRIYVFIVGFKKFEMNIFFRNSVVVAGIRQRFYHFAFSTDQHFIHGIPNCAFFISIIQMKNLVNN